MTSNQRRHFPLDLVLSLQERILFLFTYAKIEYVSDLAYERIFQQESSAAARKPRDAAAALISLKFTMHSL